MKIPYLVLIFILFISCSEKKVSPEKQEENTTKQEVIVPEFKTIIDSAKVNGAILIYDLESDTYYSNDFEWARKGNLPASTFKIANSMIALETGVVENDSSLFKWNGERRRLRIWEQDLIFRDAFHFSCVPCYQEIARKIGAIKMREYLDRLEYGSINVDSSNIDMFWLEGESKITQFQQIDFLKRFYLSELKIADRTERIMKRMMVLKETEAFKLSGKTGWSIRNGNNNGWFVGYIEAQNKTYFFAANVEPEAAFDMRLFPIIRKEVTYKAFEEMGIVKDRKEL